MKLRVTGLHFVHAKRAARNVVTTSRFPPACKTQITHKPAVRHGKRDWGASPASPRLPVSPAPCLPAPPAPRLPRLPGSPLSPAECRAL